MISPPSSSTTMPDWHPNAQPKDKTSIPTQFIGTASGAISEIQKTAQSTASGVVNDVTRTVDYRITSEARSAVSNTVNGLVGDALSKTGRVPIIGGAVRNAASGLIDKGVNGVMDSLGISELTKNAMTQIQNGLGSIFTDKPSKIIAANGSIAASGLLDAVKGGNTNIDNLLTTYGDPLAQMVDLDKTTQAFYAQTSAGAAKYSTPSPYAMDLIRLAPKHSFMFVVEIIMKPPFQRLILNECGSAALAAIIQEFDRPDIEFEYEEVNYYNFRSQIPKRTKLKPVKIKMYDDNMNVALAFIVNYLRETAPHTRIAPVGGVHNRLDEMGMGWKIGTPQNGAPPSQTDLTTGFAQSNMDASSITSAPGTYNFAMIEYIKVYQIGDFGNYTNIYWYTNPRIIDIQFDKLNMISTESSTISMEFVYDSMFIELSQRTDPNDFMAMTNIGRYPLHPNDGTVAPAGSPIAGAKNVGTWPRAAEGDGSNPKTSASVGGGIPDWTNNYNQPPATTGGGIPDWTNNYNQGASGIPPATDTLPEWHPLSNKYKGGQ